MGKRGRRTTHGKETNFTTEVEERSGDGGREGGRGERKDGMFYLHRLEDRFCRGCRFCNCIE